MESHHYIAIGCFVIVGFLGVFLVFAIAKASWAERVLAWIFGDKDE